jgi:hypothetical protein
MERCGEITAPASASPFWLSLAAAILAITLERVIWFTRWIGRLPGHLESQLLL